MMYELTVTIRRTDDGTVEQEETQVYTTRSRLDALQTFEWIEDQLARDMEEA